LALFWEEEDEGTCKAGVGGWDVEVEYCANGGGNGAVVGGAVGRSRSLGADGNDEVWELPVSVQGGRAVYGRGCGARGGGCGCEGGGD